MKFQRELNEQYRDQKKSPLEPGDFTQFKQHDFFPIDLRYRVAATVELTPRAKFFKMKTSAGIDQDYRTWGIATFELMGKKMKLSLYQSRRLMNDPEYKDYIFLPFTDGTNGSSTYGGGRYIGLRMPTSGNTLIIDFNQAYNPYCAYSKRYACPIVPAENDLDVDILAGIRLELHE